MMIHHSIKRSTTSDQTFTRPIEPACCQAWLLHCVVIPVIFGVKELREHQWNLRFQDLGVVAACFEKENRGVLVLGQFAGKDAAGRACANDDF